LPFHFNGHDRVVNSSLSMQIVIQCVSASTIDI